MNISFVFVRPAWQEPVIRSVVADGLGLGLTAMHRKRMKVKFTPAGKSEYHQPNRNKGYEAKKRRDKGHNNPNVWSGEGRRQITRAISVVPLKSQATATGTMHARFLNLSRALGWHFKKNALGVKIKVRNFRRNPDHRAEMEKVIRKDEQIIADVMKDHVTKFFNTKGKMITKRI